MSHDAILARSPSIIYQPGGTADGLVVTSWVQVQKFIAAREGAAIVYIDDSITSPAPVPGVTGVTDGLGRLEIRPYRENSNVPSTLVVEDGATLKGILRLSGTVRVLADTLGVTPGFDWDYSGAAAPTAFVEDGALIGNTTTATNPSIVVPGGDTLAILLSNFGGVLVQMSTAFISVPDATSIIRIACSEAQMFGPGSTVTVPASWITGAGESFISYDSRTIPASNGGFPQSSATTQKSYQSDTQQVEIIFTTSATNVLAAIQDGTTPFFEPLLPMVGSLYCELEGFGGTGGGGGGQAGGASNGVGGGGSGGAMLQRAFFTANLVNPLDVIVGAGGIAGAAGAAPAGSGGTGGDGGSTYVQDGTTTFILALLGGSSGGQGGAAVSGAPGRGGACYPGGVVIPNISDVNGPPYGSGFMLAGGAGGAMNTVGTNGQGGLTSLLLPSLDTTPWGGGDGGSSGAGEGGGGGGGGAGVFAPGSGGGNGQTSGTPGGNGGGASPNSGTGVGGGAGGAGVTDNGGAGGTGSTGLAKLRFFAP
jgi:hypothetical protein